MAEYGYILAFSSRHTPNCKTQKAKKCYIWKGGLTTHGKCPKFYVFLNLFSILPFPGIDRGKET